MHKTTQSFYLTKFLLFQDDFIVPGHGLTHVSNAYAKRFEAMSKNDKGAIALNRLIIHSKHSLTEEASSLAGNATAYTEKDSDRVTKSPVNNYSLSKIHPIR